MSLPVQKPGVAQAASSAPEDTASKAWFGGTIAPGSRNLTSIEPPDSFLIWSTVKFAFGPSSDSDDAKLDCICSRTFLSCAAAEPTPRAIAAAAAAPPIIPIKRILYPPVAQSHAKDVGVRYYATTGTTLPPWSIAP